MKLIVAEVFHILITDNHCDLFSQSGKLDY